MSMEKWWNETCGREKKKGETPRKTYPDSVSYTTKPTLSDRDVNSGPSINFNMQISKYIIATRF